MTAPPYVPLNPAAPRYVRLSPPPEPAPTDTAVVHVTGSTAWSDTAAVHTALTRAWRGLGRPITVAVGSPGVEAAVREWVAEHAVCGIQLATGPPGTPDLTLAFPSPTPRPTGDRK